MTVIAFDGRFFVADNKTTRSITGDFECPHCRGDVKKVHGFKKKIKKVETPYTLNDDTILYETGSGTVGYINRALEFAAVGGKTELVLKAIGISPYDAPALMFLTKDSIIRIDHDIKDETKRIQKFAIARARSYDSMVSIGSGSYIALSAMRYGGFSAMTAAYAAFNDAEGCGLGLEIIDTAKGSPDEWEIVTVSVKDIVGVEENAYANIYRQNPNKVLAAFDRAIMKRFK